MLSAQGAVNVIRARIRVDLTDRSKDPTATLNHIKGMIDMAKMTTDFSQAMFDVLHAEAEKAYKETQIARMLD